MSERRLFLPIATVVASAFLLAACGGGGGGSSDDEPGAQVSSDRMESGYVTLPEAAQSALLALFLPSDNRSITITIPAGETKTRGGVDFTCTSTSTCMLTLMNDAGVVTAKWSSTVAHDAADPVVTAALTPPPLVPEMFGGDRADADGMVALVRGTPLTATFGDDPYSEFELTGMFDPNQADDTTTTGDGEDESMVMLTATHKEGDAPMIAALDATWHQLHFKRRWADPTDPLRDGLQTDAVVYKDVEAPTDEPFGDVHTLNTGGTGTTDDPFTAITVDLSDAAVVALVAFEWPERDDPDDALENLTANLDGATDNTGDAVTGTYDGARGKYRCIVEAGCTLSREEEGGKVSGGAEATNWRFEPDANVTVSVPDPDWIGFGAWLTTPYNPDGVHRVGVFSHGNAAWVEATHGTTARLAGKAEYEGGAAGYYVYVNSQAEGGNASGLFTATASLEADFRDVTEPGTVKGSVHSFMDAVGEALGEWTVFLDGGALTADNAQVRTSAPIGTDATVAATNKTGGHADGIEWTGTWAATFHGFTAPAADNTAGAITTLPTGVTGTFNAMTSDTDTNTDGHQGPNIAVTGAFGARKDDE